MSMAFFFLTALSLQASVRKLEQQLADCESALVEETVVSQERKLQLERAQYQVAYIYSFIYKNTRFKEQMAQNVKTRIRIWIWIQVMTLLVRTNE